MSATKKPRHNATRSQHRQATARRRRELAAAQRPRVVASTSGVAPGRRRRGPVIAAVGAVGAIAAGTIAFAVTRGDDQPNPTLHGTLVAASAPEQVITAPPSSYLVSYRIELQSGAQLLDEQLLVRAPYDLRYRYGDVGALDTPLLDYVQTKDVITTTESATVNASLTTGSLPVAAHRFDATIADLVDRGFFERRERRRVLDTECTVYRTGAVTESFTVTKATDSVHADLCISDDGIVLEEVSVTSGEADMRVTATAVQRDPTIGDADFPVSTDSAVIAAGGIASTDLALGTAPTSPYWGFTADPTGWSHASRRQLDVTKSDDGTAGPVATKTSFVDTFTRGNDLLVVTQGSTGAEPETVSTTQAVDVDVSGFGTAKLVLGTNGATLVIAKDDRFIHVQGTVSVDELVRLTSTLATS